MASTGEAQREGVPATGRPLPPAPAVVNWAAAPEEDAREDGHDEEYVAYDGAYDEDEDEVQDAAPEAGAASEGGRVLVVQRQQAAAGCGPATPPLHTDQNQPRNFKTALCRHWQGGSCSHGSRCTYAHGEHELRRLERASPQAAAAHPRERTVTCRYWLAGYCKHGASCTFLHALTERRAPQQAAGGARPRSDAPHPVALPLAPPSRRAAAERQGSTQELLAVDPRELAGLLQGTHLGPGVAPPPPPPLAPRSRPGQGPPPPGGPLSPELRGVLHRRFSSLLCPLTGEPFVDPVVAADGSIYERLAIEEWLYKEGRDTSPLTQEKLPHKMLMPCSTVQRCVAEVAAYVAAMRQQVL